MNNNYTIISDPGIDDLIALAYIIKSLPNSKNILISTFGNASETITSRNAKEFIAFAAPQWEFMHGSQMPLSKQIEHPWPDYFHGPDASWGVHPEVNIEDVKIVSDVDPKNMLSLATLTDPLKLLKKGGMLNAIIMGGAFLIEGNETKYAETNIAFDPDSAAEFFKQNIGVSTSVVPLDVSRKAYWSEQKVYSIPETSKINIWLKRLLLAWFDNYDHEKEKDFNLHDPLAAYLALNPKEAEWTESGVAVVVDGEQRGRTIFNDKNPMCRVALNLKNSEKISDEIFSKIFEE